MEDKSLLKLINMDRQKKHFEIFNILTQLEKDNNFDIKEYSYKDGVLLVRVDKHDFIRVDLKEEYEISNENIG